ncbi:MAG: response regulator [Anaerolineaceae bacterium]
MNSKTILLIEDNPSDIELTRRALKKGRILNDVIVIEDGQDALDYFDGTGLFKGRDIADLPALVLLDLKLPSVTGLEILKHVRETQHTRRLPIVILTSSSEDVDIARSYDLRVNSYIRKPVDFEQFAEAVQNLGLYWLVLNELPPQR